jgi:stage III sporulation protein AD
MNILGICGGVVICIFFIISIGKGNERIGLAVSIGVCLMLLISVIEKIVPIMDYIKSIMAVDRSGYGYLSVLIKCMGIGLICSFTSELCRSSGESFIASGVELFGKCEIIILCIPIIKSLLEIAVGE